MISILNLCRGYEMTEVEGATMSDIPKMKRIATFDFQRSLAIWMMVYGHLV